MTETEQLTPLESHTLETLCNELVSGRGVAIDDKGEVFQLSEEDSRAIFGWYHKNSAKWQKNVMKTDVDALVDCLDKPVTTFPPTKVATLARKKTGIYVKKLRAHSFGGIHKYAGPTGTADDFELKFESGLTLIEGTNGSGKTSILSALIWALTGHVLRTQRAPEAITELMPLHLTDNTEAVTQHSIAPISPIPPSIVLADPTITEIQLDTWVEVTFSEESGKEIGTLRRGLNRTPRGKLEVTCNDAAFLGLDPIALEVGTRMPGLIPYIQLDKGSDLGKAVATLTGLQPLEQLASHATKTRNKLKVEMVKDREADISKTDGDYRKTRLELFELFEEHPQIKPEVEISEPSFRKDIESRLQEVQEYFETLQATAFKEARNILGESFDPNDASLRNNLKDSIGPALGLIEMSSLASLEGARRLNDLKGLADTEIDDAKKQLGQLFTQAREVAEVASDPKIAERLRLYTRIASWIKSGDRPDQSLEKCPICEAPLENKRDAKTDRAIKKHLEQCLSTDKSYLEKTVEGWIIHAEHELTAHLCKTLQSETHIDLPVSPAELITGTLVGQLLSAPCFKRSLNPLNVALESLCTQHLSKLPPFLEPTIDTLPQQFRPYEKHFLTKVSRIERAIAFSKWRKDCDNKVKEAFRKIIGFPNEEESDGDITAPIESWSVSRRLRALSRLVNNTAPLSAAISKIEYLLERIAARRKQETRIALYERAATAIEMLTSINLLVEKQVVSLMNLLKSRTTYWHEKLYIPANPSAPRFHDSKVDINGALSITVAADGTKVPAQHISNTSDLRAMLLAFLIAFWEHLKDNRGAFSTILLDDLQELFDPDNRQRIANAVPNLAAQGASLVITTNDPTFGRWLLASAQSKPIQVKRWKIHPISVYRKCLELSVFVEEIDRKRHLFLVPENQSDPQPARDYVNYLRIYIENRLLDLFEILISSLPSDPTLSDLINAVRERRRLGHELFGSKVFENLVDDAALQKNSDFLQLMNQSHHGNESSITFGAVWKAKDDYSRIRRLVDAVYEEYQAWMRRDTRRSAQQPLALPKPFEAPDIRVPIMTKLAAFAGQSAVGESVESGDFLSSTLFQNKAIFYIKTQNFGFAGAGNYRAIVNLNDFQPPDNSLVIALTNDRILARRLLRDQSRPPVIALNSEVEDPRRRPPSELLPTESTLLLPVVGLIFDERPNYEKNQHEATLETGSPLLKQVRLAFKVDGDSALPLALPGQIVFGVEQLTPDQFGRLEGTIVAIATTDGAFLKRIGAAIPGVPHVRQFEAIGARGDSIIVRTENIEDGMSKLPLLIACRKILGVMY